MQSGVEMKKLFAYIILTVGPFSNKSPLHKADERFVAADAIFHSVFRFMSQDLLHTYRSSLRAKIFRKMAAAGLDSLLVTDLATIRWLTGFSGSNAKLLFAGDSTSVLLPISGIRSRFVRRRVALLR